MKNNKGFTLIELLVVIAVVSILSSLVMFTVSTYINRSKDANVQGNLAVLVASGEVYYDHNDEGYTGYCNQDIVSNSHNSMPATKFCCNDSLTKWAACAKESDSKKAYCVDSLGARTEICSTACNSSLLQCGSEGTASCQTDESSACQ